MENQCTTAINGKITARHNLKYTMKIKLNKEEKAALLVAVSKGELDTAKIPRLYKEIRGNNDFLDMLMQLDMEDEEEATGKEIG